MSPWGMLRRGSPLPLLSTDGLLLQGFTQHSVCVIVFLRWPYEQVLCLLACLMIQFVGSKQALNNKMKAFSGQKYQLTRGIIVPAANRVT